MKKSILISLLCLIVLCVTACKKDPKMDQVNPEEIIQDSLKVATEKVEEEKKPVEKKKPKKKKPKKDAKKKNQPTSIPGTSLSTSNEDAKKYIKNYERYVSNYRKAVESKDTESFFKLSDESNALTQQYNQLMSKLPGEEIEKLSKYMQIKSDQLAELSAQL